MRTYDCQHKTVNSLEKELLYREVIRLRKLIVESEILLERAARTAEFRDGLKGEIGAFLKDKSK